MKYLSLARFLMIIGIGLLDCSDRLKVLNESTPATTGLRKLTPTEEKVANASYSFGFNLFRKINLADPDSNIFISPLSISMALGMTLNGAQNATRDEMLSTLQLSGLTQDEINQSYLSLIQLLTTADQKVVIGIANSLWYMKGIEIQHPFLQTNQNYFDAQVRELDFYSPGSIDTINSWVAMNSQNTIKQIIDQIPPNVVMLLINVLYYQSVWHYPFDKQSTRSDDFMQDDSHKTRVDMMVQTNQFVHFKNNEIEMVDLPYSDGNFAMMVILPNSSSSLDKTIETMTWECWNEWKKLAQTDSGMVYLPRFSMSYKSLLNDVLAKMGMPSAFIEGQADFSAIAPHRDLFISRVIHQAAIDVNEEGTQASVATVVELSEKNFNYPWFIMKLNRPFIYIIHERQTGIILFMGKMLHP